LVKQLPQPGDRIDRYEVLFELGRGGMSAVFAARRTGQGGFDKLLALKVLLPHIASDARFRELFLNEARLCAELEHPNVVSVFDLTEHEGLPLLVMELVRGQSLRTALEVLAPERRLAFGFRVMLAAAEGLHSAHRACKPDGTPLGIVHRDISPENILIGYDGRVKVADFGIAKGRFTSPVTITGEIRGKLAYLAPEQITRDEDVSPRTDIWALGIVLYEIIYGRSPFLGETDAETLWNITARAPTFAAGDGVPEPLVDLMRECLSRRAAERPGSAREFGRRLESAITERYACDVGEELSRAFERQRLEQAERLTGGEASPSPAREIDAAGEASVGPVETAPLRARTGAPLWLALGSLVPLAAVLAWRWSGAQASSDAEAPVPAAAASGFVTAAAPASALPEMAQKPLELAPGAASSIPVPSSRAPLPSAAQRSRSRARAVAPASAASAASKSSPLLDNPYP
jgi:serine/threonine-protein kinase